MTHPVTHHTTNAHTGGTGGDSESVAIVLRVDDVIELLELISFCHTLCVVAPKDINAAMARIVINAYNSTALGTDLTNLFQRIEHVLP